MGKLVAVEGDSVKGTDKHNVSGTATNPSPPPPTVPYQGIGSYQYVGEMTDNLSTFVKIDGKPVALITSKSSLNPGEAATGGGHSGAQGTGFVPPTPTPILDNLFNITDPIGTGVPNSAAGSALLTIGGTKVLLDGDKIDTCDGTGGTANSTVTAVGQSFVRCSG
jgi:uncharacterized Zn-binding protein involved in type VI secretion